MSPATRDLHHKTKARYQQDARTQLLQTQQTGKSYQTLVIHPISVHVEPADCANIQAISAVWR